MGLFTVSKKNQSNESAVPQSSLPPPLKKLEPSKSKVEMDFGPGRTESPVVKEIPKKILPLPEPIEEQGKKHFSLSSLMPRGKKQKPGSGTGQTRELLEAEKIYRQGLTSLKDVIAPSAVKVNPSELEISGSLTRTYFVLAYPRYLGPNWLSQIISLDFPMDMAMYIYPVDTGQILKKLRTKTGQIQSSISMQREKGMVRDPMLETAFKDVEELRDRLIQGTEHYFRFSLYFTIYADSRKDLDKHSSTIESMLGSKLIVAKKIFFTNETRL